MVPAQFLADTTREGSIQVLTCRGPEVYECFSTFTPFESLTGLAAGQRRFCRFSLPIPTRFACRAGNGCLRSFTLPSHQSGALLDPFGCSEFSYLSDCS